MLKLEHSLSLNGRTQYSRIGVALVAPTLSWRYEREGVGTSFCNLGWILIGSELNFS